MIEVDPLFKKLLEINVINKNDLLILMSFKRKYSINIYSSLMSTIHQRIKKEEKNDSDYILKSYLARWKIERPEVIKYQNTIKKVFEYCYYKYLYKHGYIEDIETKY